MAILDFESGGRLKSRSVIDRVGIRRKVGAGGGGRGRLNPVFPPPSHHEGILVIPHSPPYRKKLFYCRLDEHS